MTRHGASRSLEDRLRNSRRLIHHQQHMLAMHTGQRLRPVCRGCPSRDEAGLRRSLEGDLVRKYVETFPQHWRQFIDPRLQFRKQRVKQLSSGRCGHNTFLWITTNHVPNESPRTGCGLTDTVASTDADAPFATGYRPQEVALPRLRLCLQDVRHEPNWVFTIQVDEVNERLFVCFHFFYIFSSVWMWGGATADAPGVGLGAGGSTA